MYKRTKKIAICCILLLFISAVCAMSISAEETDGHRHVWIMTEEESSVHDIENGGHRQVRECAATVNGERCTETRVFYVHRPGCALCAAKDGECLHTDTLYVGEQSAHPHYKVYECQECGYQFTNGTMASWSWNYHSTSSNTICCQCGYHNYSASSSTRKNERSKK